MLLYVQSQLHGSWVSGSRHGVTSAGMRMGVPYVLSFIPGTDRCENIQDSSNTVLLSYSDLICMGDFSNYALH